MTDATSGPSRLRPGNAKAITTTSRASDHDSRRLLQPATPEVGVVQLCSRCSEPASSPSSKDKAKSTPSGGSITRMMFAPTSMTSPIASFASRCERPLTVTPAIAPVFMCTPPFFRSIVACSSRARRSRKCNIWSVARPIVIAGAAIILSLCSASPAAFFFMKRIRYLTASPVQEHSKNVDKQCREQPDR